MEREFRFAVQVGRQPRPPHTPPPRRACGFIKCSVSGDFLFQKLGLSRKYADQAKDYTVGCSNPGMGKGFSFLQNPPAPPLGLTQLPTQSVPGLSHFRLPPRCKWGLPSSEILRSVCGYFSHRRFGAAYRSHVQGYNGPLPWIPEKCTRPIVGVERRIVEE